MFLQSTKQNPEPLLNERDQFYSGGIAMSFKLVLAEKPSQAAAYAAALGADKRESVFYSGSGYIVAWCYGHLLELAAPDAYGERYKKWNYADLPIVPQEWIHVPAKGKAEQLKVICLLMNRADITEVINACDAGREGQLIFALIYEYAKCKKPTKRLWISSMEDAAVKDGFANLKDGAEYENLCAAAKCREQADFAVGISSTRLFSVLYGGATLNVGRVQSPTLAMLVRREDEITSFVKEPFYTPTLDLGCFTASGGKLKDRAAADNTAAACDGQSVTVTDIERVTKTVAPPKLYDLTSLQRDANRILGYTAQQTLDCVQSQYEKKMLTYPRTDAKHITADMKDTVLAIIGDVGFKPDVDRLVGKVNDHHAIIPTLESLAADVSAVPSGEREIFGLVRKRLIAAVSPNHVYESVTVTLDCGGSVFTAKGKTVIEQGWKAAQAVFDTDEDAESEDSATLPPLSKGRTFESAAVTVKEGFTKPKPHHTEATILSAMENAGAEDFKEIDGEVERKGLGTSATRAGILEALVKRGYALRSKKNLLPTDKGKNLIAVLPNALTSAKLTAEWEQKLLEVQRGTLSADEFMANIAAFIKAVVLDNNKPIPEFVNLFPDTRKSTAPELGQCPRCGGDVTEWAKGFSCANNRACGFKLWKESKFWTAKKKPLTAAIVARLLGGGKVALKDLYSEKTGKSYNAEVSFDDEGAGKIGKYVNFKMEFDNNNKGARKK
jgi:DNA topoisomerase-3